MTARRLTSAVAFALLLVLALPSPAGSVELEAAKGQGLVGERADGFLGAVVASPSADVQALVDSVNAQRRAKYTEIASKNGTALDAVAALAGQKLIERTPTGQYVTDAQGNWYKK